MEFGVRKQRVKVLFNCIGPEGRQGRCLGHSKESDIPSHIIESWLA